MAIVTYAPQRSPKLVHSVGLSITKDNAVPFLTGCVQAVGL